MSLHRLADQFVENFPADAVLPGCAGAPVLETTEAIAPGFTDFITRCGGGSFANGLYRVHTPDGILQWTETVLDSFPEYQERVVCFGYDWLGRHFALDRDRMVEGGAQVLLFDPGFHQVLDIPCGFDEFHRTELPGYADDALAASYYAKWLASGGGSPAVTECVGYRIPPIMGGVDEISNLEVIDMDVYWSLT